MRKYVLYKIFTGSLFSLLSVMPATVAADNEPNWNGWNNPQPLMKPPVGSEATSPWHLSSEQKKISKFWSQTDQQGRQYQEQNMGFSDSQIPFNQSQGGAVPYRQIPETQVWNKNQLESNARDRYVTPDIIESLNRQEAQYYSRLNRERAEYYRNPQVPLYRRQYEQYGQEYSASPSYGMGSVNPGYDVPAVSPWGDTPDVLHGGEKFPWMPNEAIGGVPPIYVPPSVGGNSANNGNGSTSKMKSEVFNPYTFLQNGN
jgi:hypothetical protein